jgi:hypothetical protein
VLSVISVQTTHWFTLSTLTMERLFSPCTRYRDILDGHEEIKGHPDGLQEFNLDVSTEELLSAERAFTYADLYTMLGNRNKIAWLTPHAAVMRRGWMASVFSFTEYFMGDDHYRFNCNVSDKHISVVASSSKELLEICDVVLRLLAASVVRSVILSEWRCPRNILINATSLAYLMEQCQSLKALTLEEIALDENHCRALGAYSRPDLEIMLTKCAITSDGTSALAEVLKCNQGPTRLDCCATDYPVLSSGLRGNSRLKLFRALISNDRDVGNQALLAIAGALRENQGLVNLELLTGDLTMNNKTWDAVCDSLKTHPKLVVITLRSESRVAPAVLKPRIQALLKMMKTNTSIHTMRLAALLCDHKLFRESVVPYLKTNRLRPRVCAIQKIRPMAYRAKVLGRALVSVRTNLNSFWMLLSGNPEVAFPSTTATTMPATADADATLNATAAATVTATRAASTTGTSAADYVATSNTSRKRKASP